MKKLSSIFFLLTILLASFLYSQPKDVISIIPKPVKVKVAEGVFNLTPATKILINEPTDELKKLGELVASSIHNLPGGKSLATAKMNNAIPTSLILLQIKKDILPPEAYSLEIKPEKITITSGGGAGIFYALQSLFQMMPVEPKQKNFSIPCALIEDSPRFKWRGVHLDVCRHIFPVAFIKKYIDILAMYKMNTFHWHLTDDQGWRIEIKKFPKLTEVGSIRKETMGDGKPYGGFYTQDEIREVVAYAQKNFITVVPEIEMPGHALAAITAYPEFSCTGGPFEVGTIWGVYDDVFCAGNDKVFDFLEDVLTEVMDLFPSQYIHIGGDECPKERWKVCPKCQARIKAENLKDEFHLQSYFVQRIEKFVNSKGRKIIGWNEILEGGLAPNAAVMSWQGVAGGIAAARSGHNVVMSPGAYCYFDHYQGLSGEPKAFGGYTNLEKVYSYEPIPDSLNNEESKFVLGAQANLWTEYIETTDQVEYMLLPRLLALSEVVWSPKKLRNYNDFSKRIIKHYDILSRKKFNYRVPTPFSENGEMVVSTKQRISMTKPIGESSIYYTKDGTEPTTSSLKYLKPLIISKPALLKAKTFLKNGKTSVTSSVMISFVDSTVNGLNYKYYEGEWSAIPNFESLTPVRTGKIYKISLSDINPREDNFGVALYGYIKIEKTGEYIFYLNSDDGSKLFLNNNELINNDGFHSKKEMSAKVNLPAGKYPVKILYFEGNGDQSLKLEYEGPGISRRTIPASLYFIN
ncbi:MAG: family 20 glycosylhydrolase [Ignavibacteriales bacterium]|nr:family 20 glycosylhydrolase [Ignavibacteriales bacterium]